MSEIIKTEADLAEKILLQYSDWELYKEVPISFTTNSGSLDIVAVREGVRMAVEAKLKINFSVMEQAYRNRRYAHLSYIAVPMPKIINAYFLKVCRDDGIGVLMVDKNGVVHEKVKPKLNRSIVLLKLESWMMESVAGSLHGRATAYSNTMAQIEQLLRRNKGRVNISNLFEKGTYHWGTSSSAKQCIATYIRKGIIKNMRIDKGYLVLLRSKEETNSPLSITILRSHSPGTFYHNNKASSIARENNRKLLEAWPLKDGYSAVIKEIDPTTVKVLGVTPEAIHITSESGDPLDLTKYPHYTLLISNYI